MSALTPLAEALGTALASLAMPKPVAMPLSAALGKVVAEDIHSPGALPDRPVALRQGFAVAALATVGATPQSPIMLETAPAAVAIGEALPDGCDAVLPSDAVTPIGRRCEITQAAAPGEAVRLAGHDVAAGAVIARRGAVVTPSLQLILQSTGIDEVPMVVPRVAIAAGPPFAAAWLDATLAALGCIPIRDSAAANIAIAWTGSDEPRLALRPGDTAAIAPRDGGTVTITLPERFDGLVAGFLALALPVVAVLSHRQIRLESRPLQQKIVSAIGSSDCVLMQVTGRGFTPLATGEITLAALAKADAFAFMPPESEGAPAGHSIAATPFRSMLQEQETP
jgi:molybdopterin molybdotransferase